MLAGSLDCGLFFQLYLEAAQSDMDTSENCQFSELNLCSRFSFHWTHEICSHIIISNFDEA